MEDPIIQTNEDQLGMETGNIDQNKSEESSNTLASDNKPGDNIQSPDNNQEQANSEPTQEQTIRTENGSGEDPSGSYTTPAASDSNNLKRDSTGKKDRSADEQNETLTTKEDDLQAPNQSAEDNFTDESQQAKPSVLTSTGTTYVIKENKVPSISDTDSLGETQSISNFGETSKSTTELDAKSQRSGGDSDKSEEKKEDNQKQSANKLSVADFNKIANLGKGSYAEVALVKKITTGKNYALKTIDKNFMKKEGKQYQVYVEKEVLKRLDHPNIIKLYSCFQEKNKLYFLLEYISGGEFADYLRVHRKLPKEQTRFFTAEIVNVLEYLHTNGIAHRDLKPENILLSTEGHIKVIDFGTARFLNVDVRTSELFKTKQEEDMVDMPDGCYDKKSHRSTFVGTAQYVSPEMLEDSECGAPADLWALGCMIYQMETGTYPFFEVNEFQTFQKIKNIDLKYPETMDAEVKDLVQKILVRDPTKRLGAGPKGSENDYEALKAHPLFKGIDFATLAEQKAPISEIPSPHKKKGTTSFHVEPEVAHRKYKLSDDFSDRTKKPEPEVVVQSPSKIPTIIDKNVTIVLSGLVDKKCGWLFFKPRQLILNSKPRLMYYDPETNQLRGEIPLQAQTKAVLESKTKFVVVTPQRKYIFKQIEHTAEKWVTLINDAVKQNNSQ